MKTWMGAAGIALAAVLGVVACSQDDFVDYSDVLPVDDGAGAGTQKSVRVDGSSEAHIALETGATLTVPKDAVEKMLDIGMARPADKDAAMLVKSLKSPDAIASAPYVLTPHGTKFKTPVTVEIPVGKETQGKLVIGWLEDEGDRKWKKLGDPIVKDGKAKIEIDHFSVLILLEADKAGLLEPAEDEDAGAAEPRDAGVGEARDAGSMTSDAGASSGAEILDATTAQEAAAPHPAPDSASQSPVKDAETDPGSGPDAQPRDAGAGPVHPSDASMPSSDSAAPFNDAGETYDAGDPFYDAAFPTYDAGELFDADEPDYDADPAPYDAGDPDGAVRVGI